MRLALIGDIHAYRLLVWPWSLLGKRIFGQLHTWLNPRRRFDFALLAPLVRRVASVEPDMVLFSGDLTSTALPGEFDDVFEALSPVVNAFPTVMAPGNHDRYTFTAARRRRFEAAAGASTASQFPYFRRFTPPADRWSLLALDGAVPRCVSSRGLVGEAQLERAREQIADLTSSDGLVVMCHYALRRPPPSPSMKWSHRLADAPDVEAMLADCPARVLYVHGHVHEPWCWPRADAGLEHVLDVNAGAPCLRRPEHPHGQGFWQIDLPDDPRQQVNLGRHVPQSSPCGRDMAVQWRTVDVQQPAADPARPTGR